MSYRTMQDLVIETIIGEESEYALRTATEVSKELKESDVIFLLSWNTGLVLVEALKKIQEAEEQGMDVEDIEGLLTEKDKSTIYGAYLLSESFEEEEENNG